MARNMVAAALPILLSLLAATPAAAQQIGTAVREVHPKLATAMCTRGGGCRQMQTSVVADALSRSLHAVGNPSLACSVSNATQCPASDPAACSRNCALEGVDYSQMGVSTSNTAAGGALTLRLFSGQGGAAKTLSPRVYLLAEDDKNYQLLKLVNQELTYDVDMSKVGCGVNGALYLSEMDASGGRSAANPAGAQYGTGYCDSQCFNTTFINGMANFNNSGACCNEMDVWEANNAATAMTPHTCSAQGPFLCSGPQCGRGTQAACDKNGCGVNPFASGARSFYGPGMSVDTTRPFTVVTQFLSDNNSTSGSLVEIRRMYVQDGRMVSTAQVMRNSSAMMGGMTGMSNGTATTLSSESALAAGVGSLDEQFCAARGNSTADFVRLGGVRGMGESLARGMVLIFSIWDSPGDFMTWLDSGNAGPCSATQGDPRVIAMNNSDAAVTFSNIRWGDIGSTISMSPNGSVLVSADTTSAASWTVRTLPGGLLAVAALLFGYLLV